ncbi:MAG: 50S ribosomal protein L9 [Deltaproteobacteria bacterium]|jgi:large subunit ribosomal protein L9|nr:50S ribosomal protein L9 [Deltaproteobacteria bacterium]
MEIILTKDVDNVGLAGQVLNVAPGYARNYLLPNSLALLANPANLKVLAKKREEFETRAKAARDQAVDLKNRISGLVLTLARKAGEKGKLYGAVTPADIVEAALAENLTLDRKRLRLSEPIKNLGDFEVSIRLHQDVTASIKVRVVAEGAAAQTPAEDQQPQTDSTESTDTTNAADAAKDGDPAPAEV